ncbi:hypothetical protein E1265_12855 [Streptomyces sp. 8K308]|nr:hypothetical protein E1265_12855 [Streptomyces sp. 8K308]
MAAPDIVVPVREGAANAQLRYALRRWAAHLPHRHVWLVGYRPPWAADVRHIPTRQTGTKYANTTLAVRAAIEHTEVSDPFLLTNDDFFVMKRLVDGVPVLHRGPVRDVERYYASRGSGKYLRGLRETRDLLVSLGHADPLSYELHVPLLVDKAGMLNTLDLGRHLDVLHKRTAYGVLSRIGGARIEDVKVLHRRPVFPVDSPFLSTMPDSFTNGAVGLHIRRTFPRACRYERPGGR